MHTLERHVQPGAARCGDPDAAGNANIDVHAPTVRWAGSQPHLMQRSCVTAAAPTCSQSLLGQLDDGGRLVLPVGSYEGQDLQRWTRHGEIISMPKTSPVSALFRCAARPDGMSKNGKEKMAVYNLRSSNA